MGSLFATLLTACSVHVFSPPSGGFPIETSAALGEGKRAVRLEAGGGGELFGPTVTSYRASLAQGMTPKLDLSLAPALTWISGGGSDNPHPGIYALRAGLKYAPIPYVALVAGLAPGGSAGGAFLSPDAGLILAGENPFAVPFVSFRGLLSIPIAARRVRIETEDDADRHDADSLPDVYYRTPTFTSGYQLSGGLKLPLVHDQSARVIPSVACALGLTALYRKSDKGGFVGIGCAVDAKF